MKIIILAAGRGMRLGKIVPKPLVSVNGRKTILDFQLEQLTKISSLSDIIIVVGYKYGQFIRKFPDLTYVYNNKYAKTNTAKSLLCAMEKIENEDVMWLNGDVFFDDSKIIELLLKCNNSCSLVNNEKCGKEEVKYCLDGKGYVKRISKQVNRSEGEVLGINLIKKKDVELFNRELAKVKDDDYFEKALENLILKNELKLKPIYVKDFFCKEVDFLTDLKKVKEYIKSKNVK